MITKKRYHRVHYWIRKKLGRAKECEDCGKTGEIVNGRWNIEWSNIDHSYKKVMKDYNARCSQCHKIYDRAHDFNA